MLLDSRQPAHVLRASPQPLLLPTESFEREGFVSDVVFPTAIVEQQERLLVYYGAGDRCTAVAETSRDALCDMLI
jgi:predicted GH43/DUF377 family glycosyl hydrolase